jgi:ATP-binding cassette subfamily D (ALD) long-chain fatty acid import protein
MRLVRHVNSIYKVRDEWHILHSLSTDFVVLDSHRVFDDRRFRYQVCMVSSKYSSTALSQAQLLIFLYIYEQAGYLLISIPVFFGDVLPKSVGGETEKATIETESKQDQTDKVAKRTQNYISNRRLLLALADAGGRLMSSYKDMAELAGYTSRVYSLLSTLHELDIGRYQGAERPIDLAADKPFYDLGHINGVVIEGVESVEFENVPIVAPAPGLARGGDVLVKALSVVVKPGEHLLITGPNVSSILPILGHGMIAYFGHP